MKGTRYKNGKKIARQSLSHSFTQPLIIHSVSQSVSQSVTHHSVSQSPSQSVTHSLSHSVIGHTFALYSAPTAFSPFPRFDESPAKHILRQYIKWWVTESQTNHIKRPPGNKPTFVIVVVVIISSNGLPLLFPCRWTLMETCK